MFHPRFVVNDHVGIVFTHSVNHLAQVMVDRAVAPLPLPTSHGDQIETGTFRQRRLNVVIQVFALVHAAGHDAHSRAPTRQRGFDLSQHILADIPHRPFKVETEHHVEIR